MLEKNADCEQIALKPAADGTIRPLQMTFCKSKSQTLFVLQIAMFRLITISLTNSILINFRAHVATAEMKPDNEVVFIAKIRTNGASFERSILPKICQNMHWCCCSVQSKDNT